MEDNKNKFIKWSIILFIALSVGTLIFIVIFANMELSGLKSNSDSKISGNLFDKEVLEKYELSWLEKPQNAKDEKQYIDKEKNYYVYECEFDNVAQSEIYIENIFNNFILKNYTVAYLFSDSSAYQDPYNRVKVSENISDFKDSKNVKTSYTIYYSNKTKETLTTLAEGLNFGCLSVLFEFNNEPNESGKYIFLIKLHETSVYNVALNY